MERKRSTGLSIFTNVGGFFVFITRIDFGQKPDLAISKEFDLQRLIYKFGR